MRRLFGLFALAPLTGFLALPFYAPVAAGGIPHIPQYYSVGREPWAPVLTHPRPTSAASFSFYIAANLFDSSTQYPYIVMGTPQTQSSNVIEFGTFQPPYFSALAAGAKLLVVLVEDSYFLEYNLGNGTLLAEIQIPGAAQGIATDSQGTTYVSTQSSSGQTGVLVYPYGATSPSYTITNGLPSPGLLALDGHDNLYVSNGNNIVVFPPGATTPVRTISQGISSPGLMTFDKAGRLIVYNSGSNAVTVYEEKHRAPLSTITDGISGPSAIVVGPTETLYVANFSGKNITEYDHEHATLSRTIATDTNGPRSIATDDKDNLYEFVLGYKSGRAFVAYTFPHQSVKPAGKPWVFFQRPYLFDEFLIATTGPAW